MGKSNRNPCEQPEGKTTLNRLRLCNQTRMETHTENIDSFSRIKSSNTKMCEIQREITYIYNQHTVGPFTHQQKISLNTVSLKFEDTAFVVKFLYVPIFPNIST